MTIYSVYDQIADLMATLPPAKIAGLRATDELQERFNQLATKAKEDNLSRQEKDELDHYVVLERLVRLAKLRADSDNAIS